MSPLNTRPTTVEIKKSKSEVFIENSKKVISEKWARKNKNIVRCRRRECGWGEPLCRRWSSSSYRPPRQRVTIGRREMDKIEVSAPWLAGVCITLNSRSSGGGGYTPYHLESALPPPPTPPPPSSRARRFSLSLYLLLFLLLLLPLAIWAPFLSPSPEALFGFSMKLFDFGELARARFIDFSNGR